MENEHTCCAIYHKIVAIKLFYICMQLHSQYAMHLRGLIIWGEGENTIGYLVLFLGISVQNKLQTKQR